jgi:3-oxoacyl-[acyl-carrier protein] reductase
MFKDKVILILGGMGDIGSKISEVFLKNNAIVCKHGLDIGEYQADLRDENQIALLINKVIKNYGRIDVIVNSVSAPAKIGRFEDKNWFDFLEHLNIQLKSSIITTQLALPFMKKLGCGRIINIITTYTIDEVPGSLSDYITAKFAILGFTKALAKDLYRYKITVNAVSPSFIRNNFTRDVPEKLVEIIQAQTPENYLKSASDVAEIVLYLASEKAANVTGQNIYEKLKNTSLSGK